MAGQPIMIVGELYYTNLGVGGGPIYPPTQPPGGGGGSPPGIWGPPGPWVTPPIANVPGVPGYRPPFTGDPGFSAPPGWGASPPGIWGGPIDPYPGHPLPQPPGLWPPPGRPAHPIWYPWTGDPGFSAPPSWGQRPPTIWGGPIDPYPGHPLPEPPTPGQPPDGQPPAEAGGNWQWGWNVSSGWHPVFVPGDKPQPVPPPDPGTEEPPAA